MGGRIGLWLLCVSAAAAQTPDRVGEYVVHDLLVIEASAFTPGFNQRDRFQSTLPRSLAGRRAVSGDRKTPMPLGMITFSGAPSEEVDVLLEHSGTAVATAPPANVRKGRVLWSSLSLRADAEPLPVFETTWLKEVFAAATDGEGLSAVRGTAALPALLYDVETGDRPEVGLQTEDGDWSVTNAGRRAVSSVAVFRPEGEGRWSVATAATLPPAPDNAPPKESDDETAEESDDDAKKPDGGEAGNLFTGILRLATGGSAPAANGSDAAKMPVKAGEPQRPDDAPVSVEALTFGEPSEADAAVSPYVDSLEGLSAAGRAYAKTLLKSRLSETHAVLVYRLAEEEQTRLFPIEVTPAAAKLERAALVLIADADPTVVGRIDELVASLGSPEWSEREAAHAELRRLGRVAAPKLEEAKSDKDPEIADRAARLLTEIDNPVAEPPAVAN